MLIFDEGPRRRDGKRAKQRAGEGSVIIIVQSVVIKCVVVKCWNMEREKKKMELHMLEIELRNISDMHENRIRLIIHLGFESRLWIGETAKSNKHAPSRRRSRNEIQLSGLIIVSVFVLVASL